DWVTSFASRRIDNKEQIAAAHDVSEEIVTKTNIAVRAFDQAGNIGNRDAAIIIQFNYTNARAQSGEGISRDLRMRGGDLTKQGRLAGIRVTDERRIRDRAQL